MDLSQLSEAQFLCDGARTVTADNPLAFDQGLLLIKELGYKFLRDLGSGYELHQVCGEPGDFVLVKDSEVVGFYSGQSLALHPQHRGRGLSTPLILAAAPHRSLPSKRTVTAAGERALRRAWRVANNLASNLWP